MSSSPTSPRIHELDGLRGLAAIAVLIYHYCYRFNELYGHAGVWLPWQTVYGRYGVNLFFIISGFVIFMSLQGDRGVKRFAWSRFTRLYPAYWLALALTFTAVSLLGLPGRETTPLQALLNVTMLQSWFDVPHVDGVYWTLGLELSFYVWIGLLLAFDRLRHLFLLGMLALGVTVLLPRIDAATWILSSHSLSQTLLIGVWPYFFAGILFYQYHRGDRARRAAVGIAACLGTIWLIQPLDAALLACAFFGLFAAMLSGRMILLKHPLMLWLGAISYSLYLIHQNLGYLLMRGLGEAGVHPYLSLVLTTVGALALASAITYLYEQPLNRWMRKRSPLKRSTCPKE